MRRSALDVLRAGYGLDAQFREGQKEAIQAAYAGGRALVVQRTGWGKSAVYFVATALLREAGRGPTLIVSPLLALMRDQVRAAEAIGLRAATLNSANRDEWAEVRRQATADELDVLLVSPERLGEPGFRDEVLRPLEPSLGLLVIDEAHCVSDWGHDFRPDFRRILETVRRLPERTGVLGTTATANDRVIADLRAQIGDMKVFRGPLMRPSLALHVHDLPDPAARYAWLAERLPELGPSGIVYVLTTEDARRVAAWLQGQGHPAEPYYGALGAEERLRLEEEFRANRLSCLVATTALGMGYDKPDVAYVVHYQTPGSIIAYYQQIGRAGRALERAEVHLLTGSEDARVNEWFVENAFPPRDCFRDVLAGMGAEPQTLARIAAGTNFRRGEVEQALKIMEVEGAVRREREGWVRLASDWSPDALPIERIGGIRREEAEAMREYARTPECRMRFLAHALDDSTADRDCGRCDRCDPKPERLPSPAFAARAGEFARGRRLTIEPKKMYPPGAVGEGAKKLPEALRHEPGIALGLWGDAGYGGLAARPGPYADELVQAVAKAGGGAAWVAWVPGERTEDLARRVAGWLGIKALPLVERKADTPKQREFRNATRRFENANAAFRVVGEPPPGLGLLVDDTVETGWTLAVVAAKLRKAGAETVRPIVLTQRLGGAE